MGYETLAIEKKLCSIVQTILLESDKSYQLPNNPLVRSLSHDFGIDSLMRLELFNRIEKQFNITLPDKIIGYSETLQDIKNAIQSHTNYQPSKILKTDITQTQLSPHPTPSLTSYSTLQDVLLSHAESMPDNTHIFFLDEDGLEEKISYRQLLEKAQSVAMRLKASGINEGERVAIMLPSHPHFFYTFMGILLARCIPVPIYPLTQASQLENYIAKEATILNNAEVAALITFKQAKKICSLLQPHVPSLRVVKIADELLQSSTTLEKFHRGHSHDYALIQYTSGSTSDPKGTLLTHYNLLSNIRAYGKALQVKATDVTVSWLPLYHDLGLIGVWLGSLYFGIPFVVMSPLTFVTRPEKWLWAIHKYRGTLSAGPNFSYELCTKKVNDDVLKELDLSCWRMAINGAELIQPETLHNFYQRFKQCGFKEESFFTVYGLAESSLGLTTPPAGRKPKIDKVDRNAYETKQYAQPSNSNSHTHLEFVSCGFPMEQHFIRIVDDAGKTLQDRQIGQIQFSGPSTMAGYYNNPQATQAVMHGEWTDTGDLGYLADGELYITGRKKDVIIKFGRNYSATEIENVVGKQNGIRKGCIIAFSLNNREIGSEKLIVIAETNSKTDQEQLLQKNSIRTSLKTQLDITPDEIVLVKPFTIPKTSSGKLQRSACKNAYLNKTLQIQKPPFALQVGKLFLQKNIFNIIKFAKKLSSLFFSLYTGVLFSITLIPAWLAVLVLPYTLAHKVTKYWIKALSLCLHCPITIKGKDYLPTTGPAILAVNHSSYIDALVLISALPSQICFIGKSSLFKAPILRTFLRKLGHIAIDKHDILNSIQNLNNIRQELNSKKIFLAFPEGTFTSTPGLRPFKTGIFKLAAEMSIPIIPLALKGTRRIFRRNSILLKSNKITLTVENPIFSSGKDWDQINDFKNKVRKVIAKYCGEPLLQHN